ncbi:TIR domain-containing protein [Glaciecola sp. 1036]|uniref:TIR domain-containing protein n=1 Tax=Alteromonadaceae TaxID=72275 RepID=UPI003CFE9951
MVPKQKQYHAFISYRHADNKQEGRKWATWLHQAIETYEVPEDLLSRKLPNGEPIPSRIYPIFRDEDELPADADLGGAITKALDRSNLLIVLCSPRAVQSTYVADEIDYFKKLGRSDRIIAAIIDGEPNASLDAGKQSSQFSAEDECFPIPLQYEYVDGARTDKRAEPIAADFRVTLDNIAQQGWTSPQALREELKHQGVANEKIAELVADYEKQLHLMLLKIIAGILGVPLSDLTQRDKEYQLALERQRAKKLRRWLGLTAGLATVAIVAGAFAYFKQQEAVEQREVAQAQTKIAEAQTVIAEQQKDKAEQELYKVSMLAARDLFSRGEIDEVRNVIHETAEKYRNIEWHWFDKLSNTRPWTVDLGGVGKSIDGTSSIFVVNEKSLIEVDKSTGNIQGRYDISIDNLWKINQAQSLVIGLQHRYSDGNLLLVQNYKTGEVLHQFVVKGVSIYQKPQEHNEKLYLVLENNQITSIDLSSFEQAFHQPSGVPEYATFTEVYVDGQHNKILLTGMGDTFMLDTQWQFQQHFDGGDLVGNYADEESPFNSDASKLALEYLNRVAIYDTQSGERVFSKRLHSFSSRDRYGPSTKINALSFINDQTLLSAGNDNTVKILNWQDETWLTLGDENGYDWDDYPIYQVHRLNAHEILVHGVSGLHLYTGEKFTNHKTLFIEGEPITSLFVSEQGNEIYMGAKNGQFQRWNKSNQLGAFQAKPKHNLRLSTPSLDYTNDGIIDASGELVASGVWFTQTFEGKQVHWLKDKENNILGAYTTEVETTNEVQKSNAETAQEIDYPFMNQQGLCISARQSGSNEIFTLLDCNSYDPPKTDWFQLSNNDRIAESNFLTNERLLLQTSGEYFLEFDITKNQIIRQWHMPTQSRGSETITVQAATFEEQDSYTSSLGEWEPIFYDDGTVLLTKDDQLYSFNLQRFSAEEVVSETETVQGACLNTTTGSSASYAKNSVKITHAPRNTEREFNFPELVDNCTWLDADNLLVDSLRITAIYNVAEGQIIHTLLNTSTSDDSIVDLNTDTSLPILPLFSVEQNKLLFEYGYERGSFDFYDEYDEYNPWKKTSYRRGARLLDLATGKSMPWLEDYKPNGNYVHAVSQDQKLVFVTEDGQQSGIWSSDGKKLHTIKSLSGELLSANFSNNGALLALGTSDRLVRIFDVQTGKLRLELAGHNDGVVNIIWLAEDSRLLSFGLDGILNLWDPNTGRLMFSYQLNKKANQILLNEKDKSLIGLFEDSRLIIPL